MNRLTDIRLHAQQLVAPQFDDPAELIRWMGMVQAQVVPLVQPAAIAFGERRIGGADPPCRQVQHPPHVLRRDEMPRRPHDVHTQDATFAQRLLHGRRCGRAQPQRDGPFGRTVLLQTKQDTLKDLQPPRLLRGIHLYLSILNLSRMKKK